MVFASVAKWTSRGCWAERLSALFSRYTASSVVALASEVALVSCSVPGSSARPGGGHRVLVARFRTMC